MKIPLLPNNVGKKNANYAGPKQDHDSTFALMVFCFFGPEVILNNLVGFYLFGPLDSV